MIIHLKETRDILFLYKMCKQPLHLQKYGNNNDNDNDKEIIPPTNPQQHLPMLYPVKAWLIVFCEY